MSHQINDINTAVAIIAATARDEAESIEQINAALAEVDKATQQNAAMAEQRQLQAALFPLKARGFPVWSESFVSEALFESQVRSQLERSAPHLFNQIGPTPVRAFRIGNSGQARERGEHGRRGNVEEF